MVKHMKNWLRRQWWKIDDAWWFLTNPCNCASCKMRRHVRFMSLIKVRPPFLAILTAVLIVVDLIQLRIICNQPKKQSWPNQITIPQLIMPPTKLSDESVVTT